MEMHWVTFTMEIEYLNIIKMNLNSEVWMELCNITVILINYFLQQIMFWCLKIGHRLHSSSRSINYTTHLKIAIQMPKN